MRYVVPIERGETGYGAYVPGLPGCVAAAKTREEVEQLICEGIALHLEAMAEDGDAIPPPTVDAPLPVFAS